jgi:hypothetical protein
VNSKWNDFRQRNPDLSKRDEMGVRGLIGVLGTDDLDTCYAAWKNMGSPAPTAPQPGLTTAQRALADGPLGTGGRPPQAANPQDRLATMSYDQIANEARQRLARGDYNVEG